MKPRWEDLNARARGLATHFLTRAQLDALAHEPQVATLAAALRAYRYPVEEGATSPAALELALRRAAAERLRIIARWSGARTAVLTVLFEDEDRRTLRALLRGAVQRTPPDARVAGLVPTPALPERAIGTLAQQGSPGAIAALLTAWGNPYGSALLAAASVAAPDLFDLELAVNRTFASRAASAARGTGLLAGYVAESVDLENAYAALVLAREGKDVIPKDVFLPGGARIAITDFEEASAAGDVGQASRRLAAAFRGSAVASAFGRAGDDPVALEDAVLRARIRHLSQLGRTAPLGPAVLLAYALRVRAEVMDLRRIIWGVALAAPPAALVEELVTV